MTARYRTGVNENYLMKRRVKLTGLTEDRRRAVLDEIDALPGINEVSITEDEHLLRVAYDASKRNIGEIEQILDRHGCAVSCDWRTRFKLNWYRFTDENAKENAGHIPHCCNKPPK